MADGRLRSRPPAEQPPAALEPGLHMLPLPGRRRPELLVPPGPARPRPLVVFFHGAGGDGRQGLPLLQQAAEDRGAVVLLPTSAGSTWDVIAGGLGADVRALDDALAAVLAQVPVDRVAFAGFSDGASYALTLGLLNGDLVDAVVAYSPGFVAATQRLGEPRLWISHGTDDPVLPAERCGRRLARVLAGSGYDVTYEEFEGGHVVPPDLVPASLTWWLGPVGDGTGTQA